MNGYSGEVHKMFQDRNRAEKFVRDNWVHEEEGYGGLTDPSGSEDSEEVSEDEGTRQGHHRRERSSKWASLKAKLSKGPGMPPLEMSAPDPSIGN